MADMSGAHGTLLAQRRGAAARTSLNRGRLHRPAIHLKSPDEIERMRAAGRVVHRAMRAAAAACTAGARTRDLDAAAAHVIHSAGATALFLNYPSFVEGEGFPGHICVSVNEEVVHGVPGPRVLCDGDLVTIDCGVMLDGWCADAAVTVPVGPCSRDHGRLLTTAGDVLDAAIDLARPGRRWSQIARVMQEIAECGGYGVVEEYVGHGIGRSLHELPQAPAFVHRRPHRKHDFTLVEGMTLAIEPMLTVGSSATVVLDDGWTVITADRMPACHVEHTIAITRFGSDVLTDGR
jgi:methionyl aminopeptidase